MLQIGDIQLYLLNDGFTKIDPGGAFGLVPRALWSRYFEPDDNHLIPMSEVCLLVKVGGRNIVIDTGMGNKLDEKMIAQWQLTRPDGGLLDALARLNVVPEDVDMVINTHLHSDHAGGNTRFIEPGSEAVVATFPNAEYVVQRREYDDAMQPNERTRATYFPYNYQPLYEKGQMHLLDGDTELAPGVTGVITRGHTPAHMSIRFESGGQSAAYLCDLASYMVHFERLGWMTAYDVEPLQTLETKRIWQQWALDNNALVIPAHDPYHRVGRLTHDERGRIKVDVVDEPFA